MDTTAATTLAQLRLCAAQDDATPVSDTRKRLPIWIRTPLDAALTDLETNLQAQGTTEGERLGSSNALKAAYDDGERLVRDVNRYLKALPRSVNQSAALAHYSLQDGLDGRLPRAKTESLLRGFVALGSAATTPLEFQLRPADVAAAAALLLAIDTHKPVASIGIRAAVTEAKDSALEVATELRRRAYHYLCAALDGGIYDPLLTAYGFDPRASSGQRTVSQEPDGEPLA